MSRHTRYSFKRAPLKPLVSDIARFLRIWDLTTFYPLIFFISVQDIPDEEALQISTW